MKWFYKKSLDGIKLVGKLRRHDRDIADIADAVGPRCYDVLLIRCPGSQVSEWITPNGRTPNVLRAYQVFYILRCRYVASNEVFHEGAEISKWYTVIKINPCR